MARLAVRINEDAFPNLVDACVRLEEAVRSVISSEASVDLRHLIGQTSEGLLRG